jgi:hypothetical protein
MNKENHRRMLQSFRDTANGMVNHRQKSIENVKNFGAVRCLGYVNGSPVGVPSRVFREGSEE